MVNEDKLSSVLSEFARTVITDFSIQGILDHLVGRIVEVLPVTAAGVTLISAGKKPHYIAASDDAALRYEQLQSKLGEGPCLAAYESGEAVAVADVKSDDRFPIFAPAAAAAGLAAVFTFPLRHGDVQLGALDLYRGTPGPLDSHDMAAAQTLADVAAAYLLNAQARETARVTSNLFHHNALHDPLTGLPNRQLLHERLEHAALRARRSHANAAVLFADLDRFKHVNDTFGHHVGDKLLLAVADRLAHLVRSGDTLARFSGDEFVILCEDINSPDDVEVLATRIRESLRSPFIIDGNTLTVTASVGIAYAGPGQDISDQLVVNADMAMYQVKGRGGGGHQIIDLREAARSGASGMLEADLRVALAADQLDLAYQPIVRTSDMAVVGVEALLRWTHPTRGEIEPLLTIAAAEKSELIIEIGQWVLRRACRDHRRWRDSSPGTDLALAVNVSTREILQPTFAAHVEEALCEADTDPAALIIEVTENVLIEDATGVADTLAMLDRVGIRVALDDFGTGFSSLSYLAHLPIHIVKIDRCFITDLTDPAGRIIVASVNTLAHDLGLTVVAEGVETQAQHDTVKQIGCDYCQGYLYDKPMDALAIETLLATSDRQLLVGRARI